MFSFSFSSERSNRECTEPFDGTAYTQGRWFKPSDSEPLRRILAKNFSDPCWSLQRISLIILWIVLLRNDVELVPRFTIVFLSLFFERYIFVDVCRSSSLNTNFVFISHVFLITWLIQWNSVYTKWNLSRILVNTRLKWTLADWIVEQNYLSSQQTRINEVPIVLSRILEDKFTNKCQYYTGSIFVTCNRKTL